MAKNFKDLSEQEILALAISSEETDARIYADFAAGLKADYPATAQIFKEMEAEEDEHRRELIEEYRRRFGEHIPLIRREDVKGFVHRRLTGAGDVMYAKDKLGIERFIQEGAPEDRSYYYSLPRVQLVGRITYTGKGGIRREIDVTGQGWVDRQSGDFLTKSWEWSSLRFSNGARVNLYNFANGHQVATYQKADGSTQWLESFLVRQNGYLKTPEQGVWLSWGWSYEFPVEVEGSRHYTLEPFSKLDVFESPNNVLFEGPSRLINDDTGGTVGVAVTESMDVRIMQNAPYAANQH